MMTGIPYSGGSCDGCVEGGEQRNPATVATGIGPGVVGITVSGRPSPVVSSTIASKRPSWLVSMGIATGRDTGCCAIGCCTTGVPIGTDGTCLVSAVSSTALALILALYIHTQ